MRFHIAVPSYDRPKKCAEQTIATLKRMRADMDTVTVFVATKEEFARYRETLPDIRIIVAKPGLAAARKHYHMEHYNEGAKILNVDDDLQKLLEKDGEAMKETTWTIPEIAELGFKLAEENRARLWGVAAAANGMFMQDSAVVGLRYIIGAFHGSYAGDKVHWGDGRPVVSSGEDFETCLRSYTSYGRVVRINWLAPKTKYFADGGIVAEIGGKEERDKDHARSLMRIAALYPKLASTYEKSGGITNIRLKPLTEKRIER